MYKKQLIIGIIALCWCGEIYAQPALPQIERTAEAIRALPAAKTIRTLPAAKKAKVVLKKKQLSLQLEQRAERTYELAQQSIKQYPSTAKLYGLSASKFITRPLPSCEEEGTSVVSNFDKLTNGNFSTVRVLQFGNEQLSKLAGFDVQIKISSPASR